MGRPGFVLGGALAGSRGFVLGGALVAGRPAWGPGGGGLRNSTLRGAAAPILPLLGFAPPSPQRQIARSWDKPGVTM